MDAYPRAAVERAMKVQEVMLRAIARKITWFQAAEILGITDRHSRRWRERYEEGGFDGLLDRRRCRPSEKRVPLETVERVLGLYRDQYFDLNVRHFHEKLRGEHGIHLSYTWVKAALQGAGELARHAGRLQRHRAPAPRRDFEYQLRAARAGTVHGRGRGHHAHAGAQGGGKDGGCAALENAARFPLSHR